MKKVFFYLTMLTIFVACEKKSNSISEGNTSEKVASISATKITPSSALLTGQIGVEIEAYESIEFGMLISNDKSKLSSYDGRKLLCSNLIGKTFSIEVTGLYSETKYYYCSYLILNDMQYEYGSIKSFNTENGIGLEAVDLGLSVKWANMNIGANTPEGYGNYYAWGETVTKKKYDWSTYFDTKDRGNNFIKYNYRGPNYILALTEDAAYVNWGEKWRMPTESEYNALIDECTWTWTIQNNVNGYKVTGKNGNSIFLPASGCCNDELLPRGGEGGYYWSSRLKVMNIYDARQANLLYFDNKYLHMSTDNRYYGNSIRAVCK
ncbi:MAG: DUF1566 domain-containing protein [bacterium]|nr:DUF1566 domain-containing protein [bacterium]